VNDQGLKAQHKTGHNKNECFSKSAVPEKLTNCHTANIYCVSWNSEICQM